MAQVVQPKGWPRPRGYANGMISAGRLLAIGGQIGAKPAGPGSEALLQRGFLAQLAQTLENLVSVVGAAGGQPTDIISMTIFVTELRQYLASTDEIRGVWKKSFGNHYPAMALVEVKGLIDPDALIEIQAMAVLP
jgi:enamine deaminase RidA (YjgF/YER057c/UK114 family)